MLLNVHHNRQNAAQKSQAGPIPLACSALMASVADAAPVSIRTARKLHHYRTPSLDGRRPDFSVSPAAIGPCGAEFARHLAHLPPLAQNSLPLGHVMSSVGNEQSGKKGKIRCQSSNGHPQSLCAPGLQPVAIRPVNRRLSAPVPVSAQRCCWTPTRLPQRQSVPPVASSIANKTPANANPLTVAGLCPPRSDHPCHDLTAAHLRARGRLACDHSITKRDKICSARS